ncbi:MAG: DUF1273 family protein [Ruminococcaceae bacterium]|nr:DUF1273 family protein [Oscillospiraceae bacterium]
MNEGIFEERLKTVCFTGHRTLPAEEELNGMIGVVDTMITTAYSHGYRIFITGGAVGFDTLAACRVIVAQKRLGDIKLRLALPCRNQTEKWTRVEDLALYKRIMGYADRVDYITDFYTKTCMLERNRFMVDRSALCIAYCTRQKGGSAYTVNYAKKEGLGVINIGDSSYSASEFVKFKKFCESEDQ